MNKQSIIDEIKYIKNQIEELEKIDDANSNLWGLTKPAEGEKYWYIEYEGFKAIECKWWHTIDDEERLAMCNVFRTKEDALLYIRKRIVFNELRKYSCDSNTIGEKCGISYDSSNKNIVITPLESFNNSSLSFSSIDVAETAINNVGRELIAKYLFGESDQYKLKELKKKLKSLQKELDNSMMNESSETGYWVPNDGDTYWYMSIYNNIDNDVWCNTREDIGRLAIGNIFRTKEEVEFEIDRLRVLSIIRPFTCGFRQTDKPLYVIIPTKDGDVTVRSYDYICLSDTTVYFESESKAYSAIKAVGENKIRKYLFGMK